MTQAGEHLLRRVADLRGRLAALDARVDAVAGVPAYDDTPGRCDLEPVEPAPPAG